MLKGHIHLHILSHTSLVGSNLHTSLPAQFPQPKITWWYSFHSKKGGHSMKEAIKCAFPQFPNSGTFFVKSHGKFIQWDRAIGIVSTEAEMLFLKENPLLRLIQKGMESSNVSLWFCSALLHFVINSLVKRPSSDDTHKTAYHPTASERRSLCFYLKHTKTWDPITVFENWSITTHNWCLNCL